MTIDIEAAKQRARKAQERAREATEGPWIFGHNDTLITIVSANPGEPHPVIARIESKVRNVSLDEADLANGRFVINARTDVPALAADVLELVERVEGAERERDEAREQAAVAQGIAANEAMILDVHREVFNALRQKQRFLDECIAPYLRKHDLEGEMLARLASIGFEDLLHLEQPADAEETLPPAPDGTPRVRVRYRQWAVRLIAKNFAEMMGTAPNYTESRVVRSDGGDLIVTVQRCEGKSPNDLRLAAEKDRAAASAESARLHTLAEGLALATRNLLEAGDRAGLGMTEDTAMDEASDALAAYAAELVALDRAVKA